jgi:hypothetical protein
MDWGDIVISLIEHGATVNFKGESCAAYIFYYLCV